MNWNKYGLYMSLFLLGLTIIVLVKVILYRIVE